MKSVQKIIYHNMLLSSLVPILIIEVTLLVMYFGINRYISQENQAILSQEVLGNLQQITASEADTIDQQLEYVSVISRLVQNEHQNFFATIDSCDRIAREPDFRVHKNGAFYKTQNDSGASLYYSSTTKMDQTALRKAICSDALDPLLKNIVDSSPIITQAYLNTWDDMNRIYPFIADAPEQYGAAINMEDYNFYFMADETHNPLREDVWTGAYLDPAGQGWMISNIVPIYNGDYLEGVSGLDVTIDRFVNKILKMELPWHAAAFLMDKNGVILAMQEGVGRLLDLHELTDHQYKNSIKGTIEKPDSFNLVKSDDGRFSDLLSKLNLPEGEVHKSKVDGRDLYISADTIEQTGWKLVTIVENDVILAPVDRLHNMSEKIGWAAIAIMFLFYCTFFFFLKKRSFALSRRMAAPIEILSERTKDIKKLMKFNNLQGNTGIAEIDQLSHNFNKMGLELDQRSKALIDAEVQQKMVEKEKEFFHQLATIDRLTKLANRHQINNSFEHEIRRSQRYNHTFGIILIDVDHFKQVNDQYGHDTGDIVLEEIAALFKQQVREVDLPGRWGGEEFIIICPDVSQDSLMQVAEKLRRSVEAYIFPTIKHITASFGAARYQKGDDIASLVNRADKALYQAKENGRNRCAIL